MRMTKRNLRNIKGIFQKKTGVALYPPHISPGRMLLLAAVIGCCCLLAAFASPLFTPLNGDELTLSGTYLGNGIVSVSVQNDSDRTLEFQEQLKLISWTTGEEIPPRKGSAVFQNTVFPPHSSGIMTIDLKEAYDVRALEATIPGRPRDVYYYLLLTNRDFLFGHDWMCSFSFRKTDALPEICTTVPASSPETAHAIDCIPEDLQFYFREAYDDVLPAFNEANFVYQQKVQEVLLRTEGTLVRPVDPGLLVERSAPTVIFDERIPSDCQHQLVGQNYHAIDGYSRIVGTEFSGTGSDYALQLSALLPRSPEDATGGVEIPLIYLFTYEASACGAEDAYAFIYGQILPFSQLEHCKVYEDEQYAVYNATEFFYTDLDAYLDYFLTTRNDLSCDDQTRTRIHAIYDYCMDPENLSFRCRPLQ